MDFHADRFRSVCNWGESLSSERIEGIFIHRARESDLRCDSPIESLFWAAWVARYDFQAILYRGTSGYGGKSNLVTLYKGLWNIPSQSDLEGYDDYVGQVDLIGTQVPIGDYRVDFIILRAARPSFPGPLIISPVVIVECDGHDFHERTKEQASRDKERDRVLQCMGYNVLRFTGSEIWRDVNSCAEQVDWFLEESISRSIASIQKNGITNGLDRESHGTVQAPEVHSAEKENALV